MIGETGEVVTYWGTDPTGRRVELPLAREPGDPTPCDVCPKIPEGRPKSRAFAADFLPWFWDAWDWFREGRACGDLKPADPLMRAVAAAFDRAERAAARAALADAVASAVIRGR